MTRNTANLAMRFPDAVSTWTTALDNNGVILHFHDQSEAIAANFRLQRFRKAYRDQLRDGEISVYDRFKVRVPPGAASIVIEPIQQMRPAAITRLDGEPIALDEPAEDVPLSLDEGDGL